MRNLIITWLLKQRRVKKCGKQGSGLQKNRWVTQKSWICILKLYWICSLLSSNLLWITMNSSAGRQMTLQWHFICWICSTLVASAFRLIHITLTQDFNQLVEDWRLMVTLNNGTLKNDQCSSKGSNPNLTMDPTWITNEGYFRLEHCPRFTTCYLIFTYNYNTPHLLKVVCSLQPQFIATA